jgi:hypothetical protein
MTAQLLAALLALYPGPRSRDIERRRESIVAMATHSSETYNVPPAVLLTVGFLETHLGTDANEGGGWGAPINRHHRHVAGTSDSAARILARSLEVCGTWERAIARFRSGLCVAPLSMRRYVRTALQLVARISARAEVPLPDHLR